MNVAVFTLISLAAVTMNVTAVGQTLNCFFYAGGPKGFSCNERSDIICTEGCKSFVTASHCTSETYPKKPVTNELCTVGFGRNTAAAKACLTGQGAFRCTGNITGTGVCYGCVPPNQVTWAN
ncbi:hypothetical protein PCANC_07595 [Puccinia coronata f. sp. avenae]|uniref:Secreted protein n=1 Tax=Puccinia coronata f. sp. avenae TaxID=200324 RepID=A0A2N5SR01_9BASI|nr:hypothetical protein PCANC_14335 [Puccinia coronata f. sp. avenae]PLW18265.1 hypothetical protein PCASD_16068 [Puccinia coronata f. sp. avenae]PLW46797.1 hypothetical protein PCASD_05995 [Puccinia coronata f. sp. avenae]PLW50384.1 hypothetical protein PCANC_07595 [Puccinia coronata f. sp. avenae]